MKTAILVASALACTTSLGAQITATLNRLPDDFTGITVQNDAAVTVLAFALCLRYVHRAAENKTPLILYVDPVTDTAADPLLPHQKRVVRPERVVLGNQCCPN